eukprot:7274756-Karenia_brevis.AAC.1
MVAIVQQFPNRRTTQGIKLVVGRPSTRDHLEAKGHQVEEKGNRLCCYMCGREGAKGKQGVGGNVLAQPYGNTLNKTGHGWCPKGKIYSRDTMLYATLGRGDIGCN